MNYLLLFPGHGTYQQGHGRHFYDEFRIVQDYFEDAQSCTGINFVKLCFGSSAQEFNEVSKNIQATFVYESAIAALLQEKKQVPSQVMGLGSGIYAALHASKALSFPDALYLLGKWSDLYENFLKNGNWQALLISSTNVPLIEDLCNKISLPDSWVKCAVISSQWVIVAGHGLAVDLLKDHLKDYTLDWQPYDAALCMMGFLDHESQQIFSSHIHKVNCKDPQLTVIDSSVGKIEHAQQVKQALENLVRQPQDWRQISNYTSVSDFILMPSDSDKSSQEILTSIFGALIILAQPQDLKKLDNKGE